MLKPIYAALCALFFSALTYGQSPIWKNNAATPNTEPQIAVREFRAVSTDFDQLKNYLLNAPSGIPAKDSDFLFELPTPNGGTATFSIVEKSVMAPELQELYPDIRTFTGQGTGDFKGAIAKIDFTLKGFHAQVLLAGKTYYIDPYSDGDLNTYLVYSRAAFYASTEKTMPLCEAVDDHLLDAPKLNQKTINNTILQEEIFSDPNPLPLTTNGSQLRTYALALACTGEYASFHGGTVPLVMSAFTTSMNRVNGVFERDLSLEMIMVANNDDLIFLNAGTDPYSNGNGGAMLTQNQNTCDDIIGSSNYDIGHVFSTGGGGVAYLQAVCNSNIKAGGVTGQSSPIGDPFDIDYVAHEMGHQWGARHTQNNPCNRSSSAAYEPGSASTIMGYAGICAPNLQSNSDDHFHNHSFNEMYNFAVTGSGNSCATTSSTGNTPPTVSVQPGGFFIPIGTPFELTATANDANSGDELTYCWEQYDLGPATDPSDNNLTDPSGNAPIFRSWSPTTSPTRVFPRLSNLVNNTTVIGELLPTYSRDLTFRCTVRDNSAGGGGVSDDEVSFQATASAGPFLVNTPNTNVTWTGNSSQNVTWSVANTNAAPVNCSAVDIFLSTDGGFTYPFQLAAGIPNNGSALVIVPNLPTSQARIKVKGSNNIFFDISNQNFTINPGAINNYDVAFTGFSSPDVEVCGNSITPVINITNLGIIDLSSLEVLYNLNGNTNQSFIWNGSLPTGESTTITLPNLTVSTGSQALNILLINPNGQTDADIFNNSGNLSFTVTAITGEELPVSNNFQNGFPGTGWSVENPDGGITWSSFFVPNGPNCSSTTVAGINFYNYNNTGQTDDLISPILDLSSAGAPELNFDYAYARYSSTLFDRLQIQVQTGCSDAWITIFDEAGLQLATAGTQTAPFTPTCANWENQVLDLSDFAGEFIRIRFRGTTGYGNNLYLDNINVVENALVDCNGVANGTAFIDDCGDCVGGTTGETACVQDCNGDFGGTAFLDNCGDCVGGNTGETACVQDCNGVFGGTAFIDNCGDCVGGTTGETACVQDCNGDFGGTAFLDNCGNCVGGNTGETACVQDCNGVFGGTAFIDNCGDCVGGTTGETACVQDCNGDFGGTAFLDNCGNCVGGNTGETACVQDCNGDFGGTAFIDDCGDCVGGNTGETACTAALQGNVVWNGNCGERSTTVWLYEPGTADLVVQYVTTLASDGTFTIADVEIGIYDMVVKVMGALSTAQTNIEITGGLNPVSIANPILGDINGNNQVNIVDVSILNGAFPSVEGAPNYNPLADLNCDGTINIVDVSLLNAAFGLTGQTAPVGN